jgi:hypothetical protein
MPNPYAEAAERVRLQEEASRQRMQSSWEALRQRLEAGAQARNVPVGAQDVTMGIPQAAQASQLGAAETRAGGIRDLLATAGAGYETQQGAQEQTFARARESAAKGYEVSSQQKKLESLMQQMQAAQAASGGGGGRGGGGGGRRRGGGGGGSSDSEFNLGAQWRAQAGIQWAMSQPDPQAAIAMLAQSNPDMAPTLYGMAGMFMGEQDLLAQEEEEERGAAQRAAFGEWHARTGGGATANRATWRHLTTMNPALRDVPRAWFPPSPRTTARRATASRASRGRTARRAARAPIGYFSGAIGA